MGLGVVHVIDDDAGVRESLAALLEAAGFEAPTYPNALAFLESLAPPRDGCILSDVRMPAMSGLELLRRLKQQPGGLPIILLTGEADVPMAVEALKAGAADFIEKPVEPARLVAAVSSALHRAEERVGRGRERAEYVRRLATLTTRERQVLDELVAGASSKAAARNLGISPRTVEAYRANVMLKTQAQSLAELVRMALEAAERDETL